jgi:predicted PurR-regulated permease PerM
VNDDLSVIRKLLSQDLMQVYVRLLLLLAIVWFCVETFAPFLPLLLWSVILAVSLYPLNAWLAGHLHLSEGKAAIVFVMCGFLIIGVP